MWADLYDQHQIARQVGNVDVATRLRDRLKVLVARDYCEQRFQGKLDYKKNPVQNKAEIWVKGNTDDPLGEPIPLAQLPELEDAKLWIGVMLDRSRQRIDKFTVRLEGTARSSGASWLVSVELDENHMGKGACGHAPIHCHVGPNHTDTPEVRVPCPPMTPWAALDWVLTLVVPDWEPLPWAKSKEDAEQKLAEVEDDRREKRLPVDMLSPRQRWFEKWRETLS